MSQLLILGNGFDLHCGLKSSYKDFFRSEILDTTGESFGLKQLQAGVSGFWESLLLEYYKAYGNQNYNWCDIETIIKDTLFSIYFGKKNEELKTYQGLCFKASMYVHNLRATINLSEFNSIEKYIFNYCVKFISVNGGEYKDNIKPLTESLLHQLQNFERRFCKYLKNQIVIPNNESEWNKEYIINAVNLLAYITGFSNKKYENINEIIYMEEKRFEERIASNHTITSWGYVNVLFEEFFNLKTVSILNFNYTDIFDVLEIESPCCYTNVHGKLCGSKCKQGCNAANVIFGIDDNLIQSQSISSELRLFSKTYRKMINSESETRILPPNDGNPIEIKFYGHSLSKADYSYFQSIFDYYDLYENNKVSLMFYYSKPYEIFDAAYNLISDYGKTLVNKEQGKNLIHKLLLENRLHIQEVKD